MYHVSDIKKFERCEKYFWLNRNLPQSFRPFIFYNENIVELSLIKLNIDKHFEGKVGDDPELAIKAMKEYETLVNARFAYHDLRIKVSIMTRYKDGYNLYFTYSSCWPKEFESKGMADTFWVLTNLGIKINHVYAIHLNALYVRGDNLNIEELLVITEYLYNSKNKAHRKIKDLIEMSYRELDPILNMMGKALLKEEIPSIRKNACTRGNKCPYFDHCFKPVEDDSIMNLVQSSFKGNMLADGIQKIKDVDITRMEGTRHQYAQVMAARNQGLYFDHYAIKSWMDDSIVYPISYLDFEWETYAYPPFKGMKPFDVLVFQYSLHVEEFDQPLKHYEYLGVKDCREAFILQLLQDIPKSGSIFVFNMEGAEKLRLIQLGNQFPKYASQLKELCDRMVDLSLPFSSGNIYDLRMAGLYSLKKLVSVFSDYRYSDLSISYGMDAVANWRLLDNLEDEEKKEIENHLFEYCAMDTYSEYIVLHAILNILKDKNIT